MEENQRQIDYEEEYEKAILDSYYDDSDDQQESNWLKYVMLKYLLVKMINYTPCVCCHWIMLSLTGHLMLHSAKLQRHDPVEQLQLIAVEEFFGTGSGTWFVEAPLRWEAQIAEWMVERANKQSLQRSGTPIKL